MSKTTIEPFWQRLPAIARYPLREGALYTIIALVAFSLLMNLPSILGFIIWVLFWIAAYKYAFEILRATANGYMDPPEQGLGDDAGEVWRYLGMQIVMILIVAASFFLLGVVPGIIMLTLMIIIQPAAIMSLAMDGAVFHALNPGTWGAIISRVGGAYFALVALLFVFQISAANASALLSAILPPFLSGLLVYAVALWGLFATFHLMGYLILQYHEALGFEPGSIDGGPALPPDRDQVLLDSVTGLVQEGDTDAAMARLREEIRSRSVSPAVHQLYRRLLQSAGDKAGLAAHGRQFIGQLLAENDERTALAVARESMEAGPLFKPLLCEHATRLAAVAERTGQSALAVQLYELAFNGFPKEPAAIDAGVKAAKLMSERQGRDAEARQLLLAARERNPNPQQAAQIDRTLALLDSIGG
ncbi:MAG: hypothetical protein R3F01_05230 [Lysobacteraceae bacterium]